MQGLIDFKLLYIRVAVLGQVTLKNVSVVEAQLAEDIIKLHLFTVDCI